MTTRIMVISGVALAAVLIPAKFINNPADPRAPIEIALDFDEKMAEYYYDYVEHGLAVWDGYYLVGTGGKLTETIKAGTWKSVSDKFPDKCTWNVIDTKTGETVAKGSSEEAVKGIELKKGQGFDVVGCNYLVLQGEDFSK